MSFYQNTVGFSIWFQGFQDTLMANSVLVQASTTAQKQAYDNWQIAAKTQFNILDKQNQLVLSFANKQATTFKSWEDYVGGKA